MMFKRMLLTCVSLLILRIGSADAQVSADPTPSTVCGLDGFQLDTLEEPAYWSVSLPSSLCVVPNGYEEVNITSCTVFFSVCRPLPAAQCGGLVTNSSTCQVVTTRDSNTHSYSIGDYRGNGGYETTADPGSGSVGFLTIRERDNLSTKLCNATFETTLVWMCDKSKVWNPASHNVTTFKYSATKGLNDCYLEIQFYYSGACYEAPTLTPDFCTLPPFDVVGLTTQEYWQATVPNEACYGDALVSCQMFIAFCQPVPPTIDPSCYNAAVCQVGMDTEGVSVAYSLGQFKDSTRFIPNDQNDLAEGIGFHMIVSNGSRPEDNKCNKDGIKTTVVLTCNMSASWKQQDVSNLIKVAYAGALEPCDYVIFLQYPGACAPVGAADAPSPVGWILIGIFFFVVLVYFTVGACYQYFVRGARGLEAIPNYEFWAAFTILVLEGCKFSLDLITCFQLRDTIKNPLKAPGTSGIDYDKI